MLLVEISPDAPLGPLCRGLEGGDHSLAAGQLLFDLPHRGQVGLLGQVDQVGSLITGGQLLEHMRLDFDPQGQRDFLEGGQVRWGVRSD